MSPVLIHLLDLIISLVIGHIAFKMVLLRGFQHGTLCWFVVEEICSAYFELKIQVGLGFCTWTFATISVFYFPKALFDSR